MKRTVFVCVSVVLLWATPAAAQTFSPDSMEYTEPEEEPVVVPGGLYPSNIVDRPLMLPAGMSEIRGDFNTVSFSDDFGFEAGLFDFIWSDLSMRVGQSNTELFFGARLKLVEPEGLESETIQTLHFGIKARSGANGMVSTRLDVSGLQSDFFTTIALQSGYYARGKIAPQVAIQGGGGVGLAQSIYRGDGEADSPLLVSLLGELTVQFQAAPLVGVEGFVTLSIPIADSSDSVEPDSVTTFGVRGTYVLNAVDLFSTLGRRSGFRDETLFLLGAALRF